MDNTTSPSATTAPTAAPDAGAPVTPAAAPQTPPPVAPAQPQVVAAPPSGGGSKKMIIIIAAFIVVAILIGVGVMMYMQTSNGNPEMSQTSNALQDSVKGISTELEQVTIEDVSADFKDVDTDLSTL